MICVRCNLASQSVKQNSQLISQLIPFWSALDEYLPMLPASDRFPVVRGRHKIACGDGGMPSVAFFLFPRIYRQTWMDSSRGAKSPSRSLSSSIFHLPSSLLHWSCKNCYPPLTPAWPIGSAEMARGKANCRPAA